MLVARLKQYVSCQVCRNNRTDLPEWFPSRRSRLQRSLLNRSFYRRLAKALMLGLVLALNNPLRVKRKELDNDKSIFSTYL